MPSNRENRVRARENDSGLPVLQVDIHGPALGLPDNPAERPTSGRDDSRTFELREVCLTHRTPCSMPTSDTKIPFRGRWHKSLAHHRAQGRTLSGLPVAGDEDSSAWSDG